MVQIQLKYTNQKKKKDTGSFIDSLAQNSNQLILQYCSKSKLLQCVFYVKMV